ncbi:6,7-dimethyl-8-ribityllumazine synthase [Aestuariivirga litoralis]|uniref:6,7-dimethyl-8-ribityllumazine synthase n=1 Tax=Aestuariivirga litoralis TaxID=2650924 RepID=A0A2W2BKC7_9HYPH|nr:6,7-dimethyl-8-ribityllumazine synthase [Aestuariivirga litoralis]PZF76357.1 6,7-dimethyl-8-ribityllumazine synthase [Aestuariivirga litoralis]
MKTEKSTAPVEQVRAHLLILEARFYGDLCDEMCRGAIAAIERAGATWERMAVPGALEIPGAIAMAHETGLYHGYVALGCVLRGETTHYDIVSEESARGIMDLTLEGLCIGNGILTCENEAQAWARAKVDDMDKGGGAAEAALHMIRFSRLMGRKAAGLDVKAAS